MVDHSAFCIQKLRVQMNQKTDCYSAGERGWMELGQRIRQRALAPVMRPLAQWQVQPDHITLFALVAGLFFHPLYFWSPSAAFAALALHVLLDGLDGPLARHLGSASRKGSFLDSFCDQLVVTVTTFTLMQAGIISGICAGFYVFTYAMVVFFAMVRNAMELPYPWLVRPRFIVYVWMLVETYFLPGSMEFVVWGFSLLLGFKMATGFNKIRRKL